MENRMLDFGNMENRMLDFGFSEMKVFQFSAGQYIPCNYKD